MSIRIYDLDREHVIDTEFGNVLNQYRDLMSEYEIPWDDADWCFDRPEVVKCYEIMGAKYAIQLCDTGYKVVVIEHDGFSLVLTYDEELTMYESILDEWRR